MDLDDIFSFKDIRSSKRVKRPVFSKQSLSKTPKKVISRPKSEDETTKVDTPKKEINISDKIFNGITFIVTGIKFDKSFVELLKKEIKNYGGTVKNFRPDTLRRDVISPNNFPRAILVSDNYQVTYKYIAALASCVPCVHFYWIEDSIKAKKILPLEKYLLPAGCDLDRNIHKLPEWFSYENQDVEDNTCPFLDKRIEIVGVKEFKHQWTTILKACGARIVSRLGVNSHIDVILSDSYPASYVIVEANEIGCPICNKEWAIQTLIQRKLQDWNDERYLVKYY